MTSRKGEKQDRPDTNEARALARAEAVWSHVFALEWQRRQDLTGFAREQVATRVANASFEAARIGAREHLEWLTREQALKSAEGA